MTIGKYLLQSNDDSDSSENEKLYNLVNTIKASSKQNTNQGYPLTQLTSNTNPLYPLGALSDSTNMHSSTQPLGNKNETNILDNK